jgi:hypothetical protein
VAEAEIATTNDGNVEPIRPTETLSTTAPIGVPIKEVRQGVEEAQRVRDTVANPGNQPESPFSRAPRSMVRALSKSKRMSRRMKDIEPYPGT